MSRQNLSFKQRAFINTYLQTGNATEAAMKVYNTSKRSVAAQIGYENLRKPEIRQAIEWYITHKNPDLVSIVEAFADVLKNGTTRQKLAASIVYFKIMGLYPCPHRSRGQISID